MYRPAVKEREDGLSLLARGKGLLDGGVEIECCFQTSYSLMVSLLIKVSSLTHSLNSNRDDSLLSHRVLVKDSMRM